jgi:hypothetical protein
MGAADKDMQVVHDLLLRRGQLLRRSHAARTSYTLLPAGAAASGLAALSEEQLSQPTDPIMPAAQRPASAKAGNRGK